MSRLSAGLARFRAEWWLRVLGSVERVASRLRGRLGRVTVVLYGSFARGDFNRWSDVDIVVVSERFRGVRPLDRYDLVVDLLEPGFEPVLLTLGEALEVFRRTGWRYALRDAVVVVDDYGLAGFIERVSGVRPTTLGELRRRVMGVLG